MSVRGLPSARILACASPLETLALDLAGAVLHGGTAPSAPWSQGDFGLAAARGALGLLLTIEDATAPGHDFVRGAGSHARATSALRAARAAGLEAAVETTLTRSNARSTGALADLLVETRVLGWRLGLLAPRDERDAIARSPSLGVCMPHVLRGVERAARGGVEVFLEDFPRCLLGPFARWQAPRLGPPASGSPCETCPSRALCPGLAALHRARFGARELGAVQPSAEAEDSDRRALARRLVAPARRTSAE